MKQVIAVGGESGERVMEYLLMQCDKDIPRIMCIPTASGDSPYVLVDFYRTLSLLKREIPTMDCTPSDLCLLHSDDPEKILDQDIIWVPGGSCRNLMAIWKAWDVYPIIRKAYDNGVIMAGTSAGANIWFEKCVINPIGDTFGVADGIGLIKGLFCPHWEDKMYSDTALKSCLGGYGCHSYSALHFKNGVPQRVPLRNGASWPVCFNNGKLGVVGTLGA